MRHLPRVCGCVCVTALLEEGGVGGWGLSWVCGAAVFPPQCDCQWASLSLAVWQDAGIISGHGGSGGGSRGDQERGGRGGGAEQRRKRREVKKGGSDEEGRGKRRGAGSGRRRGMEEEEER